MKKLAWSIIFLSLIVAVSGATVLTVIYTDAMLTFFMIMGLDLLFVGIMSSVIWAIGEVKK